MKLLQFFSITLLFVEGVNIHANCPSTSEVLQDVVQYFPSSFESGVSLFNQIPKQIVYTQEGKRWKLVDFEGTYLTDMRRKITNVTTWYDETANPRLCVYRTSDIKQTPHYYVKPLSLKFAEVIAEPDSGCFNITSISFYRKSYESAQAELVSKPICSYFVRPSSEVGIYTLTFNSPEGYIGNIRLEAHQIASKEALDGAMAEFQQNCMAQNASK